jgi:poly(hydroxyalkanoate) depolymerase family esterase
MVRSSLVPIVLMFAATSADLSGQRDPEPSGADGSWEWVELSGHPGRRYRLFVPGSAGAKAPLVVMLHGCTQDPDDFARGSRFNRVAAEHGVLVAYPEQTATHNPQRCWNWFLPEHQRAEGEPGLVAAVARQVMASRSVDSARVYVGGVSAGGAMALNTIATVPGLFAAVGSHSGVAYRAAGDMPSALAAMRGADLPLRDMLRSASSAALEHGPPAVIALHGEADAVVSPRNLAAVFFQWSGVHGAGLARDDSLQLGGRAAVRTRFMQGDQYPVEAWRIAGLGHAWSGGSREGTYADPAGPDASRLMLEFFLAHPRAAR